MKRYCLPLLGGPLVVALTASAALVGHYRLEEGALDPTTNTVYCAVSTNIGTLAGTALPTWVTSGLPPVPAPGTTAALAFDPTGNSADPPRVMTTLLTGNDSGSGLAGNRPKSITAWIKPNAVQPETAPTIVHFGQATPNGARVTFRLASGAGGWVTRIEVQGAGFDGTTNVADGNWHHVAVVIPTNATVAQCRLYVDGVQTGTPAGTVAINTYTNYPVVIGSTYGSGLNPPGRGFAGLIDDVRIYNEALSPESILALYLGSGTPVSITAQPTNQFMLLGSTNTTVTFTVGAAGSPPLHYQWFQNGTPRSGATNASLVLAPASGSDLGSYFVIVSNSINTVTSAVVTLTYSSGPVVPAAQNVLVGGTATFTLTGMPGYQTYAYQWRKNGTNLPNATNVSLTLGPVSLGDAGSYTVVSTLGLNSVESAPATLGVLPAPTQAYTAVVSNDNPVAWWRLNEAPGSYTASDIIGGRVASSSFGDLYGDLRWGQEGALLGDANSCVRFTGYSLGARAGRAMLDVSYDASLNPSVFSVECWALLTGDNAVYRTPLASRAAASGVAKGYLFYVTPAGLWQFWVGTGTNWTQLTGPAASLNEWVHLVGTYDGTTARFYVNSVEVANTVTAFAPNDLYGLRIGAGDTESTSGNYFWPGRVDEVAVYDSALSVARVQAHYAAAFQAGAAPRFTLSPLTRATMVGADLTLQAKVHSTPPVTLQWRRNGTNLAGATTATLNLTGVTAATAGNYQLVATHQSASVTSAVAAVSVLEGEAVNVNLRGYSTRTIAGSGEGRAGFVRLPTWNEIAYNQNNGSVTGLLNHRGESLPITVSWAANNNRQWNGAFGTPTGDFALLNGFVENTNVGPVTVTISNIPPAYQSAGYTLYVYMSAPHATGGLVEPTTWFGAVRVGSTTNYYHAIDLSQWEGRYVLATNTNPNDPAPGDANLAVFTGLTAGTVSIVAEPHPSGLTGPASISAFQLVAPVVTAVPLSITVAGSVPVLSWTGNWVLQTRSSLTGGTWVDVPGATSPYSVPTPLAQQAYYRLRSP